MIVDAKPVKTNTTVWTGVLTPEQTAQLMIKALRDELGTPYNGMSFKVVRTERAAEGRMPVIHYELVHDHEWYMRPEAAAD